MKTCFWKSLSTPVFLALITIVLLVSVSTLGLLTINKTITSTGTIVVSNPDLNVFSDSQGTQPLTTFDWGSIVPGTTVNHTIYLKNTGDVPLALDMMPESWNPVAAANSMTITWNKESSVLAVGQITSAVLTLNADADISGVTTFSVSIILSGTG
ncbi:MAG: hypothetical protein ACFCUE_08270 [Candidatus Bathyarchaeia archaeon]|jgi:hypothetical protein